MSGLMHWLVAPWWHAVVVSGAALWVAIAGTVILATLAAGRWERGTSAFAPADVDEHADQMHAALTGRPVSDLAPAVAEAGGWTDADEVALNRLLRANAPKEES